MISPFGIEHGDFAKVNHEVFTVAKPASKKDLIGINGPGFKGKRAQISRTPKKDLKHLNRLDTFKNEMKMGRFMP